MADTTTTADPGNVPEERTILWVSTFTSQCGACGHNADPAENAHDMTVMRGEGCGEVFTHISTGYIQITAEQLQEMRPDLTVIR